MHNRSTAGTGANTRRRISSTVGTDAAAIRTMVSDAPDWLAGQMNAAL